jgi:predicted RND superfamily exporter protein
MIKKKHLRDAKSKTSPLERGLEYLAKLQAKYTVLILVFFLLLTIFMGVGLTKVSFESDITSEMPQQLPIYRLSDAVGDTFGGQDSVMLLFQIDTTHDDSSLPDDIRSADLMRFMISLQEKLLEESLVDSVTSPALAFTSIPPEMITDDMLLQVLATSPEINSFFSDDFTATMMIIQADVGAGEKKLTQLKEVVETSIASVPNVPGYSIIITGMPSVIQTIFKYLKEDSVKTLLYASMFIFILLLVVERSFTKSILIFIPLLIW